MTESSLFIFDWSNKVVMNMIELSSMGLSLHVLSSEEILLVLSDSMSLFNTSTLDQKSIEAPTRINRVKQVLVF